MPTIVQEINYLSSPFALDSDTPPLLAEDYDTTVVKYLNQILNTAIQQGASDIHFEPYEQEYRIRYRQDGLLIEVAQPPLSLANRISSRLKVMANLDIAERRKPQDGRFQLSRPSSHNVDCRISTCPTINGEKVVVRILDTRAIQLDIDSLGMSSLQKEHFLRCLHKPQGLILVSGPTGSGKTVTLYTALQLLNSKEKNISTAEDPVEIKIPGINQVNMNSKVGLSFSNILRSFLRQDPDIIMIGEIRDLETAELAIKAAHTGHLVLATVHSNSAAETLTRLRNLGVPSFNLANSVSLLLAQRLARRLCEHCKPQLGCTHCTNGYSGRLGLFEVMPISIPIRQLILSEANSLDILELAQGEGMQSIYQSGLEKVKQGLTTLEEVNRVALS
ncbi:Type II traffic warden ATPase [Legionella massiliensis]|uniref:Type II traffic warden ATPase n=1 Tax=Legionella massiliensis TaxID=1034943 RepID=A0A078KV65_9GAMM|nr:ATPase, T2SS/T4P/T4SS family [Legionella massiliensis]CDZ78330.1 Type II traffic warden ATPase [Legionella massiliensis]CEE14068.1 Type II secretion system protein E [Legionella massiliensis]